ncbi:MAG TPA: polysaccharide biosynthesis tyrosine autokinase [Anaerolineae bacterium]|nr:polysaccharide biosynthesis tyrosine autokinase [Anaerolineae bacterium]
MELKQYLAILRKWWWLLILVAAVAGVGSYYATLQQPKLYQATAKIMVGESVSSPNLNSGDIATASVLAGTYIQLVKTSAVLQGIKDELNLNTSIDELRNAVSADTVQRTQFIEVRANDSNPERAARIANAAANQLILQGPASSEGELASQRKFVQDQIEDLQSKIQNANDQISNLEASIKTTTSVREISDKQAEIDRLRTDIAQWQQNYTQFINYLSPRTPNTLAILEPATPPTAPFAPNVVLNVSLATVVGLVLATAVAFLIEYFDDTLKNKEDVSRYLHASTLGEIGALRNKNDKLVTASEPRSANAEAYRMLRTNISFASVDKPIKTILVTSASPSEGKSVTASNLAVSMAQAGYRTILLDCDLRRPAQQRVFNLSNDAGLTNCLLAHAQIMSYVRPTRVENLRVLPTGPLPPNPSELLSSLSMGKLFDTLRADADVVIVDSPPVLAVADPIILSRLCDGVLLVIDSGKTRREPGEQAVEAIQKAGARLLGIVLNRVSDRGRYTSYNNKYYHYASEKSASRSSAAPSSTS